MSMPFLRFIAGKPFIGASALNFPLQINMDIATFKHVVLAIFVSNLVVS
jgi:hypothetical protein